MFIKKLLKNLKGAFYKKYWHFAIKYTLNATAKVYKSFNGMQGLNPTVKAEGLIFKMEASDDVYSYLDIIDEDTKHYLMGHNSLLTNEIYVYFKNILNSSRITKNLINIKKLNSLIALTVIHELSHSEQSGYDYLRSCKTKEESRNFLEYQNFKNYSLFILNNIDKINKVIKIDKNFIKDTLFKLELDLAMNCNAENIEFVKTPDKYRNIKSLLVQALLRINSEQGVDDKFAVDVANYLDYSKNLSFIINNNDNKRYDVVINGNETKEAVKFKNEVDTIIKSYFKYDKDTSTLIIDCETE